MKRDEHAQMTEERFGGRPTSSNEPEPLGNPTRDGKTDPGPLATALQTVAVAFSMFSAVPMPAVPWTPRTMRFALAAFPLVGIALGFAGLLWCALCGALGLTGVPFAAGLVALPLLLTGGIHMDGFADVEDARASHAGRERMLQIMADPHVGSFAVVKVGVYLIVYLGAASALEPSVRCALMLASIYIACRASSGLAIAAFPVAKDSGLARTFSDSAARRGVAAIDAAVCAAAGALATAACGVAGFAAFCAVLVAFAWYRYLSERLVGGVTGDFAGWYLQVAELSAVCAFVLANAVLAAGGAL